MSNQWVKIEQISEDDLKYCTFLSLDTRDMHCFLASECQIGDAAKITIDQLQKSIIQEKDLIPLIKNLKSWRKSPVFKLIGYDSDNKFWGLKYIKFYRYSEDSFSIHDRYNNPIDTSLLIEANIIE